ncbi:hypothetical protein AB1L42_18410 [Thalassoglobus sp. JC818]|uniref:hypothetical protein n=1 Tax=Thalassoglobus sp. JC818 TaxID=3232136 RepID=UPI0034596998
MASKVNSLLVVVVVICLSLSCRPAHGERGVRSSSASWTIVSEDPVPGISKATVEAVTLRMGAPEPLKVVFWCADASGSSMRSSADKDSAVSEGVFSLQGDEIPIRCETKDGRTASVMIEDHLLHTDQGTLFLITKGSSEVKVLQLDVDVMRLPTSVDGLRDYAKSNEKIVNFFAGEEKASDASSTQ